MTTESGAQCLLQVAVVWQCPRIHTVWNCTVWCEHATSISCQFPEGHYQSESNLAFKQSAFVLHRAKVSKWLSLHWCLAGKINVAVQGSALTVTWTRYSYFLPHTLWNPIWHFSFTYQSYFCWDPHSPSKNISCWSPLHEKGMTVTVSLKSLIPRDILHQIADPDSATDERWMLNNCHHNLSTLVFGPMQNVAIGVVFPCWVCTRFDQQMTKRARTATHTLRDTFRISPALAPDRNQHLCSWASTETKKNTQRWDEESLERDTTQCTTGIPMDHAKRRADRLRINSSCALPRFTVIHHDVSHTSLQNEICAISFIVVPCFLGKWLNQW